MYTFQALQILLFLIPGFISSAMLYSLVIRHDKSELSRIIEALVFSLLTYAFYSLRRCAKITLTFLSFILYSV